MHIYTYCMLCKNVSDEKHCLFYLFVCKQCEVLLSWVIKHAHERQRERSNTRVSWTQLVSGSMFLRWILYESERSRIQNVFRVFLGSKWGGGGTNLKMLPSSKHFIQATYSATLLVYLIDMSVKLSFSTKNMQKHHFKSCLYQIQLTPSISRYALWCRNNNTF